MMTVSFFLRFSKLRLIANAGLKLLLITQICTGVDLFQKKINTCCSFLPKKSSQPQDMNYSFQTIQCRLLFLDLMLIATIQYNLIKLDYKSGLLKLNCFHGHPKKRCWSVIFAAAIPTLIFRILVGSLDFSVVKL